MKPQVRVQIMVSLVERIPSDEPDEPPFERTHLIGRCSTPLNDVRDSEQYKEDYINSVATLTDKAIADSSFLFPERSEGKRKDEDDTDDLPIG